MLSTIEVTRNPSAPNMVPVRNPSSGAARIDHSGRIPATVVTIITETVKKKPLVPAQSSSRISRSWTDIGASSIPS